MKFLRGLLPQLQRTYTAKAFKKTLDHGDFEIQKKVTELDQAGKHAVYVTRHKDTGKIYYLKDIVDSAEYHIHYDKAVESGQSTEGIYPSIEEQRFRVEKEVFATRFMHLILGDQHTPASIYPVVKRDASGKTLSYFVASQSVGDYVSLMNTQFFVKDGITMINIGGQVYSTYGRFRTKITQYLMGERDGNLQNMGVCMNVPQPLPVVTIDHEHAFETRENIDVATAIKSLVEANVPTPFGARMDLHQEHIISRNPTRLKAIEDITELLRDEKTVMGLLYNTFSPSTLALYPHKVKHIIDHLTLMRTIFQQAHHTLQNKSTPLVTQRPTLK